MSSEADDRHHPGDDHSSPQEPFEFDSEAFDRAFEAEFGSLAPEVGASGSLMCVVWTPIASGEVLAGICTLQRIAVDVIPSSQGALAVVEVPVTPEIDFELLTQGVPAAVEKIALDLSKVAPSGVVLLSARLRQGEEGISGDITAVAYETGERGEEVSPGLVLARADDSLLGLLTGTTTLEQIPTRIDARTLSTKKAAQYIRKGLRKRKK